MISDHLSRLTYYFPWSLVVTLLLAVIFGIIGIWIFRRALKKDEEDTSQAPFSPLIEKSKSFLARFGYFATDPLSLSFSYALKLMHDFIGGTQFRYQLPWVVMLGTSGAGKSTALHSLDLDRPIGRPHFESEGGDKPPCDWWFYDHGIVLDLDGKIVVNPSQATSDEEQWRLFLNLLTHHRPKRPLDAVVLAIPASEIYGQNALSHDDILIRAEYLYGKLWEMQHLTGIRVPIYVVVTKCDLIPGFDSFCQSIPSRNRRDMFGWSNNHAVDSTYDSEWIDEAFSSINSSFYRTQEEIYTDGKTIDGRDGVFLFPLALNQLMGGIRTYADHLFKPSGYHETFFLRGIYFIGDSHINKSTLEQESSQEVASSFNQETKKESRNLYFVDNLFESKIFREVGLARPISRVLLGNTTSLHLAKIAVAVAAVVGTLGLLRSNETLQNAKLNLVPALTQIEVTLKKISGQNEDSDIGRHAFDAQAQALLNTLTQISVNHLSSVFIPPSWFSNLDAKIKHVMGLAYDRVIIQSMANQLAFKARKLFDLNTIIPVTETTHNGIDPLEITEFYRLRNYVVSTKALELAANKFNELGTTTSLKDVAEIIKYLFNYDMPATFYNHTDYYIDALKHTNIKVFDFDMYGNDASVKLRQLFDQFQFAVFDPKNMVPGLGALMTSLYEFSGMRNYSAYDADLLREVFNNLKETIGSIDNPGLQWINSDQFDPGPQYESTLGLIVGSNFFTSTIATDLFREVDQNFLKFRQTLAGFTSPLIKGENLFAVDNGLAIAQPSIGARSLLENLAFFFAQDFMAQSEGKTIVTDIPIGSVLLWDTLRLQEAVQLIQSYNNFMNSRLLSMPKMLQPFLQKVGRDSLTKNLINYVADAEVFNSDTTRDSNISPEDSLLSQVQNYRAAATYLEQILFVLRANNANSAFSALKNLLTAQTYAPLIKLDEILTEEAPYAIKDNSFDWWDGNKFAALEAFGVTNVTELKNFLELQRDRINYLAREFAVPLVSFLEQINMEGMPGNLPLVNKWAAILNALSGYEKKAPGNGLAKLEDFILHALNEVTLTTCRKYSDTTSTLSLVQDFFVSTLLDIQEKLHKRCVDFSGEVSVCNYSQLAQFFNTHLAGRFPFVKDVDDTTPDANPEDIRTFFRMLDSQPTNLRASLQQATKLGPSGKSALAFIEQMEKVRIFFGEYLAPDSTLPFPAFSFDVTFRVNREREIRANEIIDWSLTTQDTILTMRSLFKVGFWKEGNPVDMTFRWALNSPLQPMASRNIPNFEIRGENATFSYTGTWAFLRLLRQHQAPPSDFDSLNDENPITLRFDIPLTNSASIKGVCATGENDTPQATVFVRLRVSPLKMGPLKRPEPEMMPPKRPVPNEPEQPKIVMGPPVSLPFFPLVAPRLSTSGSSEW